MTWHLNITLSKKKKKKDSNVTVHFLIRRVLSNGFQHLTLRSSCVPIHTDGSNDVCLNVFLSMDCFIHRALEMLK